MLLSAPLGIAPGVKPIEAVVILQAKPQHSGGNFLAVAAGKRVQTDRRIAPPPEAHFSCLRVLLEEIAELAVIALAGMARSVIVRGEIEVVRVRVSQPAAHTHKLGFL